MVVDSSPLTASVIASAHISIPFAEVAQARASVVAAFAESLTNSLVKQMLEQTVAGLLVIDQIRRQAPDVPTDAGIIAYPVKPGRKRMADTILKFQEHGAWSVSPHHIPHVSLHSMAGIFSQALRSHGPNIGVSGMEGSESEAILLAWSMLFGENLPGIYIISTGWNHPGFPAEGDMCTASGVFLQRQTPGYPTMTLCMSAAHGRTESASGTSMAQVIVNGPKSGNSTIPLKHGGCILVREATR